MLLERRVGGSLGHGALYGAGWLEDTEDVKDEVMMPEIMPEVIWTDAVFYDGQSRLGRVVRCPEAGDLVFEVEHGHDAMMQKIWKRSQDGAFREFLIHCGNVLALAQKK